MPKDLAVDQDFQDPKEYHQAIFNNVVKNIEAGLESGELTAEEAEAYHLNALAELNIRLLMEDGYSEEDATTIVLGEEAEDDYEEEATPEQVTYSENDMNLAQFQKENKETLNDFAIALAELIEEEYETPDDGILTIAETTGYEPNDIIELLTGEAVPDETLVDQIATCFDTVIGDEDTFVALHLLGASARGEDVMDEEADDDDEYEVEGEENGYAPEESQELSAAYNTIEQLQGRMAQFEAQSHLKDQLDQLVRKAETMVQEFKLMPVEFNMLFGSVPDALDSEKVAMFSTLCDKQGVSIEVELYAMNKCLELAARRGTIMPSGRVVNEEFSQEEVANAEFNSNVADQAARNLELFKQQGHLKLQ